MVGGPSREAQRQSGDQIGLALTYAPDDVPQVHKHALMTSSRPTISLSMLSGHQKDFSRSRISMFLGHLGLPLRAGIYLSSARGMGVFGGGVIFHARGSAVRTRAAELWVLNPTHGHMPYGAQWAPETTGLSCATYGSAGSILYATWPYF